MGVYFAVTLLHMASFIVAIQCKHNASDFIPPDYSRYLPPVPESSDGKHIVNISIQFINLMDINELKGSIQFSCFFRVLWFDSRLRPQNTSRDKPVRIPEQVADRLWRPDIVTDNVRKVVRNGIIKPTFYTGRFWGKTMFVSKYLSMQIGCSFSYRGYPFDVQICRMHFTNMGMTTDDVHLYWKDNSGYSMERNTFLTFQDRFKMRMCEDKTSPVRHTKLGEHPMKTLILIMQRNYMTYTVQLFLPSMLFVFIAWLSILIPPTMLRTRLLLNSTNMLTILSMFVAISHADATYIPKVSYLTALSLWMYVCVAFVFSSLLVVIFDIRLIAMLTQPQLQQVRRLVLGVYQRRRSTRQGCRSAVQLVQEDEDGSHSAAIAAAAAALQSSDEPAEDAEDADGDLFVDASSRPVAAAPSEETAEAMERRLRRRRRLWLELTSFYERIYFLTFPTLFVAFLAVFCWFYMRQRQLRLAEILEIVRGSEADPSAAGARCWCTDDDDWVGCMTKEQYAQHA